MISGTNDPTGGVAMDALATIDLSTLKDRCESAMRELIAKHGYGLHDFGRAHGDEAIDAPADLDARFSQNGFIEPGPLKGTALLFRRTSYEYDEWDYELPSGCLAEIELWSSMSDDDMRRLAGEASEAEYVPSRARA